ncbi:trans-aconitate 2-methyltransferase [Alternaria panax]|uniref:Trans-aconitate 2-methyltransferase n=1 Tax=Alternaria panax TaxID=48097 RepID=A0AAD4FF09_9PLEO|nr:trans-aconitate 2-methyltransferase [Alternaria panax]
MSVAKTKRQDWSASQYLKFNNQRTRAVYDLVSQVKPRIFSPNPCIYDLGCGPGNSTKVLLDAFPEARITGMDSSPDMLESAKAMFQDEQAVEFTYGDLSTFKPDEKADLLFSNAVFHWLRSPERIPTLVRLFESLEKGGVLAIQVPDNYHEPSHRLMRDVASQTHKPWSASFASTTIGDLSDATRPDLDPIEPPSAFYNALIEHASHVNIWRTNYMHLLKDAGAIVEWVKGTGLQPFLNLIESRNGKKEFLKEYERKLKREYPVLQDGNVMLGYPRLFIVAVRKQAAKK